MLMVPPMSNDLDIPDLDFEIGPAGGILQFGEEIITEAKNQTSDKYAKRKMRKWR